jgi:hypothetical protein
MRRVRPECKLIRHALDKNGLGGSKSRKATEKIEPSWRFAWGVMMAICMQVILPCAVKHTEI